MRKLVGTMVVGCCLGAAVLCGTASGAGIVTHAWMADDARAYVEHPALKALLDANRAQLRSGAVYPDSGYVVSNRPGGDYGEEAHWPRFVEGYVARIRARTDCGDLTNPTGPCAPEIAHLLGAAAHGMGDEAWDWLMEPASVDHGETYAPASVSFLFGTGGTEAQMDMIAVGRHHRPTNPVPTLPSITDLLGAYADIGRTDLLAQPQAEGNAFSSGQLGAERALAAVHADPVAAAMPWSATHMIVGPGGVRWAAKAIAGSFDSIWGRLLGTPIPARVANVHPADGELAVPATGWTRDVGPGTRTGAATTRIVAALSDSPPFRRATTDATPIPALPAGAMTLAKLGPGDAETAVPARSGFPKLVPYGPDAGEHLLDLQPASDLEPCTTYRVRVTANLLDAAGAPFTPRTWTFRTGTEAGGACPDDPPIVAEVDPLSAPYEEIAEPKVDPPVVDPPPVIPPVLVPPSIDPPATKPPVVCKTTSVRVSLRVPRGATKVAVTSRASGGKAVKLRIKKGSVTVSLSKTGKRTTVTLSARVAGRTRTATRTLPSCTTKTKATSLAVTAPKAKKKKGKR